MRFIGLAIALALMSVILWLGEDSITPAGSSNGPVEVNTAASAFGDVGDASASSAWLVAVGFMLLASFLSGGVAGSARLPKVTGYLAVGVIVGPAMLGFIQGPMIEEMAIIKGLAVSLIALNAGGELNIAWVRQRLREVLVIFASKVSVVLVAVASGVYLLRGQLSTIPLEQPGVLLSVVILVCIVALANSPMVAIALINETRSEGPFSRLVLVISVFKDIFLVIAFTVALEVCRTLTSDASLSGGAFTELILFKVLGSIAFGSAVGWLLAMYVRRVGREMPLVVLGACFFIVLVGEQLHFKPLLAALAAGCFIENFAKDAGHKVIEGIRRSSLPVYCLFFALAGVELHLNELRALGPIVATLALIRLGGVWFGTWAGTRLARSEPVVAKYLWTGLLSQAGLSLAFASIIGEAFEWGPSVATLLIAIIVINEVFGPIIFNWALNASGEAGKAPGNPQAAGQQTPPALPNAAQALPVG